MKIGSGGGGTTGAGLGGRGLKVAFGLLVVVTLGGTLGYMALEGWSLLDAFYMTVISLTSVGFGEVHPLSPAGKIFTVLVILGGVVVVAVALGYGSRIVLEGQLMRIMGRRKMEKEIARMRDHYIICGYGRMGRVITREFLKKPMPFVCVPGRRKSCARTPSAAPGSPTPSCGRPSSTSSTW